MLRMKNSNDEEEEAGNDRQAAYIYYFFVFAQKRLVEKQAMSFKNFFTTTPKSQSAKKVTCL